MRQKVFILLTLAVISTTLISLFNLNSILIMLLIGCRLFWDGRPLSVVQTAFSQKIFLAYLSLFLIEMLGLFYTHDWYTAYKHVESKSTLIALPLFLCGGELIDKQGFRLLMRSYCFLLAAVSVFCIGAAVADFRQTSDPAVFFYHSLTEILQMNAVFFSAYILCAIVFLLSPQGRGQGRTALITLFTVMMVLLSSKLLLILLAVIFLAYWRKWGRLRLKRVHTVPIVILIIIGTGALAFTNTPMRQRYQEIMHDDLRYTHAHNVPPHAVFNGVSLRLLIWRFATEILNDNHRWAIGVSAGDSQDLLNRKYLEANMSRGFISYNFHNEYIEILVRSGIVGLAIFLAAITFLIGLARQTGTLEGWFLLSMLLLLAMTESTLEMQHSLFLFSFFPLLFAIPSSNSVKDSSKPRVRHGNLLLQTQAISPPHPPAETPKPAPEYDTQTPPASYWQPTTPADWR
jgi:O-antigen ligase